jgi:hypothetical protein
MAAMVSFKCIVELPDFNLSVKRWALNVKSFKFKLLTLNIKRLTLNLRSDSLVYSSSAGGGVCLSLQVSKRIGGEAA